MGCGDITDGVWVWPEGLGHYVGVHGVRLGEEFVKDVVERVRRRRRGKAKGEGEGRVKMWDEIEGVEMEVAKGDEAWLRVNSTIYDGK